VLHVADLARQYEARGAVSFRGFVEELIDAAERGKQPEATIYEEGSEGVRMMSVHRAKGLAFPIVILADITCTIAHDDPDRFLNAERGLCAVRLAGWLPQQMIDHAAGWHDFRHALSTKLRRSGVHPKVVWDILGHKKVNLAMDVYDRTDVQDFVQPLSLVVKELLSSCYPERAATTSER
jgi:hypothetical protein